MIITSRTFDSTDTETEDITYESEKDSYKKILQESNRPKK